MSQCVMSPLFRSFRWLASLWLQVFRTLLLERFYDLGFGKSFACLFLMEQTMQLRLWLQAVLRSRALCSQVAMWQWMQKWMFKGRNCHLVLRAETLTALLPSRYKYQQITRFYLQQCLSSTSCAKFYNKIELQRINSKAVRQGCDLATWPSFSVKAA